MSTRMSRKAIHQRADVNADAVPVTYFPFPEYTNKIAYSCGLYGCTGVLLRGETSGLLYEANPYGNESGHICSAFVNSFGARERAIIENLERVETLEHADTAAAVVAFIARDGSRFTANTTDHGRTWTICG